MKKLEQHLQEKRITYIYSPNTPYPEEPILEAVKEWLQECMDEIPNRLEYYYSNEPEQMQTLGRVKQMKELLEALEK